MQEQTLSPIAILPNVLTFAQDSPGSNFLLSNNQCWHWPGNS